MENALWQSTKGTPRKPYKKPFSALHSFELLRKGYCCQVIRVALREKIQSEYLYQKLVKGSNLYILMLFKRLR